MNFRLGNDGFIAWNIQKSRLVLILSIMSLCVCLIPVKFTLRFYYEDALHVERWKPLKKAPKISRQLSGQQNRCRSAALSKSALVHRLRRVAAYRVIKTRLLLENCVKTQTEFFLHLIMESVYSFENGLDKYWKSELIKFKYDAKPPGFDPANLKRRQNLELNIEA